MSSLLPLLNPLAWARAARQFLAERLLLGGKNVRGATFYAPGHFYSPLLDVAAIEKLGGDVPHDGPEYWDCIDLRPAEQRLFYEQMQTHYPPPPFPSQKSEDYRFYAPNGWFPVSDANTAAALIQRERPKRVIEIGSGFSTAAMLDAADYAGLAVSFLCIEPFPERLRELIFPRDLEKLRLLSQRVQEVPLAEFDSLAEHDFLFVDSSHVAKAGSDVPHILLRILPRLRPGVLVHFHDIFYPHTMPLAWVRQGRAWNESLFLRAFLAGNREFEVVAFNSYATQQFADLFGQSSSPAYQGGGASIWLRKKEM